MQMTPDSTAMFLKRIKKSQNQDGCWEWLGRINAMGYGEFDYKGIGYLAHRFSYLYHLGEFDLKMFVCHKCDCRTCTNPEHLFLGTHKDNMDDKVQKKRHTKGEDVWISKFDRETVNYIRELYSTNRYSIRELAKMFEVHHATIWHMLKRTTWKDD